MENALCCIEILNTETNLWECIYDKNKQPIDLVNNCLKYWVEDFFSEINLIHLLNKIEGNSQPTSIKNYKGLPNDCSTQILCEYNFLYVPNLCENVSYIDFKELINFDYNKMINLNELPIDEIKHYYPRLMEKRGCLVPYKELLSQDYFTELQKLKLLYGNDKCRIIYFVFSFEDEICNDSENDFDSI